MSWKENQNDQTSIYNLLPVNTLVHWNVWGENNSPGVFFGDVSFYLFIVKLSALQMMKMITWI